MAHGCQLEFPLPLFALDFEPNPTSLAMQNCAAVFVTTVKAKMSRWPLLYTDRWELGPGNPNFSQQVFSSLS